MNDKIYYNNIDYIKFISIYLIIRKSMSIDCLNIIQDSICKEIDIRDINSNFDIFFPFGIEPYEIPSDLSSIYPAKKEEIKFDIKRYNIPGRKVFIKKNKYFHDKNASDNIFRTLIVHYMNFILDYVNAILKIFGYKVKFYDIDYKYKSNISIKRINFLKTSKICEVLCMKISRKYRTLIKANDKLNESILEEVTKNDIIKNILNEEYLYLFKEVYIKNRREINLTRYGYNLSINLPKEVKTFENLVNKKNIGISKVYEMKLRNLIAKHFKLMFFSD